MTLPMATPVPVGDLAAMPGVTVSTMKILLVVSVLPTKLVALTFAMCSPSVWTVNW
jgi:hypothetical protein